MHKLYTDKKEIFECKIKLEGASIKNAKVRIILETNELNLMFNGIIESDGTCKVSIKKLKNILPEFSTGNMKLEVIADDTFFEPWQSEFNVITSKKVQVEVKQQDTKDEKNIIISEVKVEHTIPKKPKIKKVIKEFNNEHVTIIAEYLNTKGITAKNITKHKTEIMPIIKTYIKKTNIKNQNLFLKEVIKKL